MLLNEVIRGMVNENWKLISTDKDLQKFMIGAFSLLLIIITYCAVWGDFDRAEQYFYWADQMISGTFSYTDLGADVPPLTLLLLIPPRLVSPTPEVYCYVFSLYGFAFYMLGGHFMLKSCRETGYSQRDAYILLFVMFLCAFSFMTLSTGSFAPALVIMSLWFYQKKNYTLSFIALGLATMIGIWPVILAVIYVILLFNRQNTANGINDFFDAKWGFLAYTIICIILFFVPTNGFDPQWAYINFENTNYPESYLGGFYSLFDLNNSGNIHFPVASLIIILLAIGIRKTDFGLGSAALILEIGLISLLIQYNEFVGCEYIWIAMLLPMTQMFEKPFKFQKQLYLSFVAFSVCSLLCESVLDVSTTMFDAVSVIRLICLISLAFLLLIQYYVMYIKEKSQPENTPLKI